MECISRGSPENRIDRIENFFFIHLFIDTERLPGSDGSPEVSASAFCKLEYWKSWRNDLVQVVKSKSQYSKRPKSHFVAKHPRVRGDNCPISG